MNTKTHTTALDYAVYKHEQRLGKIIFNLGSLLSESEKEEFKNKFPRYSVLIWEKMNSVFFSKLEQACKDKNLKEVLDEEIKKEEDLEMLKYFLSLFKVEYQYKLISIFKKVSPQFFLLDLDSKMVKEIRSWKKL